uniref:WAT1-related protein n=2 Tax=Opuntia streptacantha TaxID=393608 RepID=A0A7C9A7W1_OPUST
MVNLGVLRRERVEGWVIVGGLVGIQFIYAGNTVFFSYLMSLGLSPLSLIILSTLPTFFLLSPISFLFEREQWPKKFSTKLLFQLVYVSFTGVTLLQSLFLKGLKMTSTAIATAMPNLAPGIIFLLSWVFGFEQVRLSCKYSRVKIIGTLICVVGAVTMSILQGTNRASGLDSTPLLGHVFNKEKIIGCLYLTLAVFILSSNVVLQAHILGELPAPMTLCAATSLIGFVTTVLAQVAQEHRIRLSWSLVSSRDLIAFSLLLGFLGGVCVSFNGWALKKRGPVLVSMFSPIATVISAILSAVTLEETITFGSLAGMFLMFTGLYFVLWAKGKESLQKIEVPKKV